jgi:hypothetical protein
VDTAPALEPKSGQAGDGVRVGVGGGAVVEPGDADDAEVALAAVEAPHVSEETAKEIGVNRAEERSEASGSVNSAIRQRCWSSQGKALGSGSRVPPGWTVPFTGRETVPVPEASAGGPSTGVPLQPVMSTASSRHWRSWTTASAGTPVHRACTY